MENRIEVSRSWTEGKKKELLFNKHRVSIQDDEKVLEMDDGESCTTL